MSSGSDAGAPVVDDALAARADRRERVSTIWRSTLVAVVSLFVAIYAFLASTYVDRASEYTDIAGRMNVDMVRADLRANVDHLIDALVWVQEQTGEDASPAEAAERLDALLSERWQDAIARGEATGQDGWPTDTAYWAQLDASAKVLTDQQAELALLARSMSQYAVRLTGAGVVFAAVLVLLSITPADSGADASGPAARLRRANIRLALATVATLLALVGIGIGAPSVLALMWGSG